MLCKFALIALALSLVACAGAPATPLTPTTPTTPPTPPTPTTPPTPDPTPFAPQSIQVNADCSTLCIHGLSSGSLPKWRKLELDLSTAAQVSNPFDPDQIDLRVRFVPPVGDPVVVPAFFYQHEGQRGWKARFTPAVEGRWTAQALLQTPQSFAGNVVSFDVLPAEPGSHGFLRVDARNPRYLAFDDGTPFFAIGLNLAWWKDDPIRDYERWFDALRANGANTARVWMAPQSFALEWSDTPLGDYSARMDRAYFLDRVLEMAEARGIYLQLTLLDYSQFSLNVYPLWHENPYNAANGGPCARPRDFATDPTARALFKRRLRYIAARWGYSTNVLAWEWWNEVDFTEVVETELLKPWIEEMTAVLRAYDPYRHLTTTSYSIPGDPRIWNMPEIDLIQRHEYRSDDARWFKPIEGGAELFRHLADVEIKPLIMGEFAATYTFEAPNALTRDGVQFHNGLWAAAFNGFASTAMYWWWDTLVEPANLWAHYKGIATFLQGEDLALFTARPTHVDPERAAIALALARDDRVLIWLRSRAYSMDEGIYQYMIQRSTGQANENTFRFEPRQLHDIAITVAGLRDGVFRIEWFDTVTGALLAETSGVASKGAITIAAPPFSRDLAAKITAT